MSILIRAAAAYLVLLAAVVAVELYRYSPVPPGETSHSRCGRYSTGSWRWVW